jgi:hypothetical protein
MNGRVIIIGAALLSAGCSTLYTSSLDRDERPTPRDAFVYGSFWLLGPANGNVTMGIVLDCRDGKRYTLRFLERDPLQVFKVSPTTCTQTGTVMIGGDKEASDPEVRPLESRELVFEPGKAYYLGDFTGSVVPHGRGRWGWKLESNKDKYQATTRELRAAYPNLAGIPSASQMIGQDQPSSAVAETPGTPVPREHPTEEPVRGSSGVPAHTGFQMALSTGYAFALGSADGTISQSAFVSGQVPVLLEIGGKLFEPLFLGVYLGAGFGTAGGALSSTCATTGVSCSSRTIRGGLEGIWYILPAARFDPYVGLGFGVESTTVTTSSRAMTASLAAFGVEVPVIFGADYRLNRFIGFGPYVDLAVGSYQDIVVHGSSSSLSGELGDKTTHVWFILGARATLFP